MGRTANASVNTGVEKEQKIGTLVYDQLLVEIVPCSILIKWLINNLSTHDQCPF